NIYEKKHLDDVPLPEEETVEQAIPRDFTELLDENTRKLYDEQNQNPDVYTNGEQKFVSKL
mgnify:CR=1